MASLYHARPPLRENIPSLQRQVTVTLRMQWGDSGTGRFLLSSAGQCKDSQIHRPLQEIVGHSHFCS
jgi:hypothetical protein